MTAAPAREGDGAGRGLKARVRRWLDSDLVGVAATVYGFLVLVLAFVVFRIGGGVGGMVVIVVSWVPMVLFAIRGWGKPPAPLHIDVPPKGPRHRVLVIANRGLEDEALCDEVCRRTARTATEAMIVAPVAASSPLRELSDDVDREMEVTQRRLSGALDRLHAEGVQADGRVDIAHPMDSLMDGLREYPPNEVVLLPRGEAGWDEAGDLAERIRAETGLPVTAVNSSPA
jgi:hypothetical protein